MRLKPNIKITKKACPLFVPIAEEGLAHSKIAEIAARYYLEGFSHSDTLHLGCTHYPLLKETIQKVVGRKVTIIDSAKPVAVKLKQLLTQKKLLNQSKKKGKYSFHLTDVTNRTGEIAKRFLGFDIVSQIKKIHI